MSQKDVKKIVFCSLDEYKTMEKETGAEYIIDATDISEAIHNSEGVEAEHPNGNSASDPNQKPDFIWAPIYYKEFPIRGSKNEDKYSIIFNGVMTYWDKFGEDKSITLKDDLIDYDNLVIEKVWSGNSNYSFFKIHFKYKNDEYPSIKKYDNSKNLWDYPIDFSTDLSYKIMSPNDTSEIKDLEINKKNHWENSYIREKIPDQEYNFKYIQTISSNYFGIPRTNSETIPEQYMDSFNEFKTRQINFLKSFNNKFFIKNYEENANNSAILEIGDIPFNLAPGAKIDFKKLIRS